MTAMGHDRPLRQQQRMAVQGRRADLSDARANGEDAPKATVKASSNRTLMIAPAMASVRSIPP